MCARPRWPASSRPARCAGAPTCCRTVAIPRVYDTQVGPGAPLAQPAEPLPADDPTVIAYHERNPQARGAPVRALDFVLELPQRKRPLGALLDAPLELDVDGGSVRALR